MAAKQSTMTAPDADQVTQKAEEAGVRLVRFLYTDNGGVTRGKSTPLPFLRQRIDDGIGLTKAMQAMNMLDQLAPVDGMGPVGEIRLVPDPATFRVLPYAPHAAAMTVDMLNHDGSPWEACPRSFLKRQIAACAEAGFGVQAVFEVEFSLAQKTADGAFAPDIPIDKARPAEFVFQANVQKTLSQMREDEALERAAKAESPVKAENDARATAAE